jgi:hypothetical protein
MQKVNYKLTIANWSVDSSNDPRTEAVEIETRMSVDSPADYCRISVYAPPAKKKSLLEEAAGAAMSALGLGGGAKKEEGFSVDIRGKKVKPDDQIMVELTAGDVSGTVMTAGVQAITSSLGLTTIVGRTGMQGLANTRVNQVYQNQSLSQIVQDLAKQVGIDTGQIDDGSTYSYFVVHESKNVLRHIRELAMRDGVDVYFDENNKLTVQKFTKSSADHTFYYGIDILDLQLLNYPPVAEHVFAYGESSSSSTGSDTWHWIVKDLKSVQGEAGKGAKLLGLNDGAVRTKDLAASLAASKAGALKDSATAGRLRLMGNPAVKLGEAIEIKSAPKPELNGLFKVTSVRHIYNKREGYVTLVGFSGKGGSEAAGGLLGQLAGALAGAIGL